MKESEKAGMHKVNAHQHRIEATARETFQALLESAPYAIVCVDKDGHIAIANAQAERTFGYRRDELYGRPLEILLPERFRNAHEKHRIDYYANPVMRSIDAGFELFGLRKNGSEFPADISLNSVEAEDGLLAMATIIDISERKKNEEALTLFRALIDRSNDAIEVLDPETGKFLDVNEKGCVDLGYSREEFLGLSVFDIDPLVSPSSFREVVRELRKSGSLLWEGIHRRKDGSTFPVEVNIKYVHLECDHMVTVVRDITERKQAEGRLKAREAELEQQVERQEALLKIGQAVQEMTRPSDLERVVKVCYEQLIGLGFDFQSLMIHRLLDEENKVFESFEVHSDGAVDRRVRESRNIHRMWSAGETTCRPDLMRDMDGLTPDRLEKISARCGADIRCILDVPHPCGTLALLSPHPEAFSDLEIRFMEQVTWMISLGILRVQDMEHLDALVRHFPDGVCLLDGKHRLIFTNPVAEAYTRIFGMALGQVVLEIGGRSLADLLIPHQEGLSHEVKIEAPAARVFEIDAQPIHAEAANGGWVIVFRDVTRDREIQARQQQQNQLAAVGQLAAGIAHDFNNLLTVMMGTAQMVGVCHDVPSVLKEDMQMIYTQGRRAADLVRQILDFSRQTVAARQPLDLVPFIKESVKLLERTLPETVKIDADIQEACCMVNANLTQLQQVLTNLSVNARDAMLAGGVLSFELSHATFGEGEKPPLPDMRPGQWIRWKVADTGCGMRPEVVAHIFEPFFTTKPPHEGTGLGLAQVYGIVKQHGGEISVHTEPGKGSAFTIYLPACDMPEVRKAVLAPGISEGYGETILVVEDNPHVLKVAASFVKSFNYNVVTASDGREALERFDQSKDAISLVLTDLVMPDIGGRELFRLLKEKSPGIKVVVMTGYSTGMEENADLLREVDGYLNKPLVREKVGQALHQALHGIG